MQMLTLQNRSKRQLQTWMQKLLENGPMNRLNDWVTQDRGEHRSIHWRASLYLLCQVSHRIQRKSMHSWPQGQYNHRRTSIDRISCSHRIPSTLQCLSRVRCTMILPFPSKHRKNWSHRTQAVNIWRPVQWIEGHNVLSLMFRFHNNRLFVLLRDEHTGCVGGNHHVDKELIRNDVQLLHFLALNVWTPREAIAAVRR